MRYERLDEPIEVIAHFAEGKVRPLRFLWRGRAHRVEAVRGRWVSLQGQAKRHHWAVRAAGVGACELALDLDPIRWIIREVAIEG